MSSERYKEYHIGIDYGTSNSCVGIFMNGTVQIIPNRIGERTTPSIVCFTEENKGKALVGEETLNQNIDNYRNTIYEVKRFIGLSYEDFTENEYDKNLNYEVVNQNGLPKIKIVLNGKESFYSAEEISSFIIKKMVECAEEFIDQKGEGIKIKKAIITVPAHFTDQQKNAVRSAAKLAGIEIPRIINEPTAAALCYGVGHNLVPSNGNTGLNRIRTLNKNKNEDSGEAPLAIERFKSKSQENAIVLDLGGGTLDITLLNITKNNEGTIGFEVIATDGDIHLGGSDFDNKLIDFCISEFCKTTGNQEERVRQDKKSCKRLKIKCENAKKLLSVTKETIINIDNFYGNEDLGTHITRDLFDDLCKDLYKRIEDLLIEVIFSAGKEINEIDEIILVGGATRITGVKNMLKRIFGNEKVKDNLNPDEAVAFGATMEAAKMEEKDKINFNLQDVVAYKLGISSINNDPSDRKTNGDLMYTIIPRFSKIPFSSEKGFGIELSQQFPNIILKIYEGNDKYVNKNTFLGEMEIGNINKFGKIDYNVKFSVDVNSQLTATVTIDSLGIKKEQVIKNFTHAVLNVENKKIKICKTKNLKTISTVIDSIDCSKQKLTESYDINNKLENLNDCCQNYEELISNYMVFVNDNESVYEKIYTNTKELFNYYIERIKLKEKCEKDIPGIILKIKDSMKNLISQVGYIEELLDMFTEIKQINELKNVYYEIFINFMELMNSEGLAKKENKKFSRYYAKLYFEREFYSIKKYIKDDDILNMNESNKKKFEKEKSINEEELKKVNSFSIFIEKKIKEGKFLYGKTGFTMIGKKIEAYEEDMENMSEEQLKEILDLFENMTDSFDKKENSIGEAYCLAHIIYINYTFFKRGYDKLWKHINRIKTLLFSINDKYDWAEKAKQTIKKIEAEKKTTDGK
jgi:molecular chaperone DnaK (HSP70)